MLFRTYAALFAGLVTAANQNATDKYLKVDFAVNTSDSNSTSRASRNGLSKRGVKEIDISGENEYYAMNLKVGSQRSDNVVALDTGSSDLWIMANNVDCFYPTNTKRSIDESSGLLNRRLLDAEIKSSPTEKKAHTKTLLGTIGGTCTAEGSFSTAASDSFNANSSVGPFSILYGDGSTARGIWGSDIIQFGSVNVTDVNFAVANHSSSNTGVFGIGLATNEASHLTYENFPMQLKNKGFIERNVYSLYLNKADKLAGSVLFGGVDHNKYSGKLQTVPLVNIYPDQSGNATEFDIVLNSITLESSSQNVTVFNSSMAVLLDSGTSLTYLPAPLFKAFGKLLHGAATSAGYYRVNCRYNTDSRFAVFNFSGVEIHVPLSSLILTLGSQCYLAIGSMDYDPKTAAWGILGDNFLRNAYVVYDLENYEVSLAPIKFSDTENIEAVTGSIPLAVKAPHYSATELAIPIVIGKNSYFRSTDLKKSQGTSGYQLPKSLVVGAVVLCFVFLFWT